MEDGAFGGRDGGGGGGDFGLGCGDTGGTIGGFGEWPGLTRGGGGGEALALWDTTLSLWEKSWEASLM